MVDCEWAVASHKEVAHKLVVFQMVACDEQGVAHKLVVSHVGEAHTRVAFPLVACDDDD